jgi:hypothetical protein
VVSSKLTARRSTARKPPICIPPPPPPPTWIPPAVIPTHTIATFSGFPPVPPIDRVIACPRTDATSEWTGSYNGGPFDYEVIIFTFNGTFNLLQLHLYGYNQSYAWNAQAFNIPITIPGPATYHITAWDVKNPGNMTLELYFTF